MLIDNAGVMNDKIHAFYVYLKDTRPPCVSMYAKKDFELSDIIPCETAGTNVPIIRTGPVNSVIIPAGLKLVVYSGSSYAGVATVYEGPAQTNLASEAHSY